jgi:hypothetical protein
VRTTIHAARTDDQGHGNPAHPAVVAVDGTRGRDGRAVPISGPDRAVELDLIEAAAELCFELAQSIRMAGWPIASLRRIGASQGLGFREVHFRGAPWCP